MYCKKMLLSRPAVLTDHSETDLVRVVVHVKVFQETGGEFTEEGVVGLVDGPDAPVRVVVGAGARAEASHWEETDRNQVKHGSTKSYR